MEKETKEIMMICPKAEECKEECKDGFCRHRKKHGVTKYNMCTWQGVGPNGDDCPPCIPYVRELKVGDKVRVIFPRTSGDRFEKDELCEVISISSEFSYYIQSLYRTDQFWYVNPKYIEYIEKEDEMKKTEYKSTGKALFLWDIIRNSRITGTEIRKLVGEIQQNTDYDKNTNLLDYSWFLVYAQKHDCFTRWLLEKGYIKEVQSAADRWFDERPALTNAYSGKPINIGPTGKKQIIEWAKRMPKE